MLLSKDFVDARNGKEIFFIEKNFTNQRTMINNEIKQNRKHEKYDSIKSLLSNNKVNEAKLQRKYKNIIAAKKSRDNAKNRLLVLERINKELISENSKLKMMLNSYNEFNRKIKLNSPSKISINSINNSNSFDDTTCDIQKSKYINCLNCGYLNIANQYEEERSENSNCSINKSNTEFRSLLEISSVNNNSSLFSSHLSKLSMLIGLICLICIIFSNSSTTNSISKVQTITKLEENTISKRNLQELPFKETKLMERPSSSIQMYSGNNEYSFFEKVKERESPIISPSSLSLSEQRENFIKKISNLDNSKCFYNSRNQSNIVPYNLGNKQERNVIKLEKQIQNNTGSLILSDNSYLDSSSLNSFRNIGNYYNNKNPSNSSDNDCFYLHMIIPNKILQMNNVYFSNEDNTFWELGCKIFEFKQVIR